MDTSRLQKLRLDHPAEPAVRSERAPANRRRSILFLVFIVIGGAAALLFWPKQKAREQATATQARPAGEAPAQVPAAAPAGVFTAAGYLEPIPPYPISVSALVAGRVDEFSILEGTPVKAGDVLAQLNPSLFEKRVAELEAELEVNAAKLAQAEQVFARTEKLSAIGSAAAKELERVRAEAAIARAEQARLQTALDLAQWQLDNTVVRAPVNGVVYERLAQVGEFVSPDAVEKKGATIVTLYDPAKVQAWVDVTQRDASRVTFGQRAEIALDAEPGKTYTGRVIRVQPRASLQKNTVQVKVAIENPSPMLRPDMSAKVSFFPAENQPANANHP